jgi:hypothetical protein
VAGNDVHTTSVDIGKHAFDSDGSASLIAVNRAGHDQSRA